MDSEQLRVVVVAALLACGALWIIASYVWSMAGTWERVFDEHEAQEGARPERMTLVQLGPFITGRRDIVGGHQELSGFSLGLALNLTRRDHGVQSLVALGFPAPIAKQLDGEITAKLKLRLIEGGTMLDGVFIPQKVEFTHRPPKITGAVYLDPQPRRYRRVTPIEVSSLATSALVEPVPLEKVEAEPT
jgi:hypothetical protein